MKGWFYEPEAWLSAHGLTETDVIVGEVLIFTFVMIPLLYGIFWMKRRAHRAWLEAYSTEESVREWKTDQEWRKPTGIRLLEELKTELLKAERIVTAASQSALKIQQRKMSVYWARSYHTSWITEPAKLREQLERLWAGDTHLEVEDRKEGIQIRKRRQADLSADQTETRRRFDEEIFSLERELRDLEEVKLRARMRSAVSPHQAQYQQSQEIDQLDVTEAARDRLRDGRTKVEALRQLNVEIEKVEKDQRLTAEQKEKSIELLKKDVETLFEDAKAVKAVEIYKAGR